MNDQIKSPILILGKIPASDPKRVVAFGISFNFIAINNYLRLAIIVICNATIRPIDAIIGNNNEFS